MKATEAKLLDFLKKSPQFVIPIYQRTYSLTEKECRQLWDDVVRCGVTKRSPFTSLAPLFILKAGCRRSPIRHPC
jgi:hypothetical protein